MKYVEIDFDFVCDKIVAGLLCVSYIPSENQLVDTLTKPLSHSRYIAARSKLAVLDGTPILRGRISQTCT